MNKFDVRVLSGRKLDAMVAVALGKNVQVKTTDMILEGLDPELDADLIEHHRQNKTVRLQIVNDDGVWDGYVPRYSSDWAVGGALLEREISNHERRQGYFHCNKFAKPDSRWAAGTAVWSYGDTLLEAAMRVIVMYYLGEPVELPQGL